MKPEKALIVSLHDVHPGSWAKVEAQREALRHWGVAAVSWLVVPEFHHQQSWATTSLTGLLSEQQAAGDELVLHGYFHDRQGLTERWQDVFWTRFYTNQEAEFYDLPVREAERRLEMGRALFREHGWACPGFIAPAWLMSPGLVELLRRMGFLYTNRLRELIRLSAPGWTQPTQSLCYSTRASWRRVVSRYWNQWLYRRLAQTDCLRLSLHPHDFDYAPLRTQIEGLVKQALAHGFQPMHYAGYVAAR